MVHLYPVGRVNYINYLPTHVALRVMAVTEVCRHMSRSPGHCACLKSTGTISKQDLTIAATAAKRHFTTQNNEKVTEVCKYRSRSPGHSTCLKSTGTISKQVLTIVATASKTHFTPQNNDSH